MAVLNELSVDTSIKESDIRIEWYSGTGAGGQFRNKTQNSCRLIHVPSGTVATAQTRSRQNSYAEALAVLKLRVKEQVLSKSNALYSKDRKDQMGSGMRGDKIRTYRFQEDIVKDHNTGKSITCTKALDGYIDLLWN